MIGIQGDNLDELRSNPEKLISTAKHFVGDGGTYRGIDQGNTICHWKIYLNNMDKVLYGN